MMLVRPHPIETAFLGVNFVLDVVLPQGGCEVAVELFIRDRPVFGGLFHPGVGHEMGMGELHGVSSADNTNGLKIRWARDRSREPTKLILVVSRRRSCQPN